MQGVTESRNEHSVATAGCRSAGPAALDRGEDGLCAPRRARAARRVGRRAACDKLVLFFHLFGFFALGAGRTAPKPPQEIRDHTPQKSGRTDFYLRLWRARKKQNIVFAIFSNFYSAFFSILYSSKNHFGLARTFLCFFYHLARFFFFFFR